jgi:type III pantothenate kinase
MESGLFWGSLGMIEGLIRRQKAEINDPRTRVIATGGLSSLFAEHTTLIDVLHPTLTLDGLRILWEVNRAVQES